MSHTPQVDKTQAGNCQKLKVQSYTVLTDEMQYYYYCPHFKKYLKLKFSLEYLEFFHKKNIAPILQHFPPIFFSIWVCLPCLEWKIPEASAQSRLLQKKNYTVPQIFPSEEVNDRVARKLTFSSNFERKNTLSRESDSFLTDPMAYLNCNNFKSWIKIFKCQKVRCRRF